MGIHVKNGTPMHGPSLCDSCSRAHIAKGYRATEVLVICDALYRDHPVHFPVRECTHYLDKNRRDFEEMEKIAWIIHRDRLGLPHGIDLSSIVATHIAWSMARRDG